MSQMRSDSQPADEKEIVRRQLQSKLDWNLSNMARLDRDGRRLKWMLLLVLLGIPVGYLWGSFAGMLTSGVILFTIATGAYFVWGHRTQYERKIWELEDKLRQI